MKIGDVFYWHGNRCKLTGFFDNEIADVETYDELEYTWVEAQLWSKTVVWTV